MRSLLQDVPLAFCVINLHFQAACSHTVSINFLQEFITCFGNSIECLFITEHMDIFFGIKTFKTTIVDWKWECSCCLFCRERTLANGMSFTVLLWFSAPQISVQISLKDSVFSLFQNADKDRHSDSRAMPLQNVPGDLRLMEQKDIFVHVQRDKGRDWQQDGWRDRDAKKWVLAWREGVKTRVMVGLPSGGVRQILREIISFQLYCNSLRV